MSKFKIDFFELLFLAEACIPPSPIARATFWQNLTNVYYEQMTDNERSRLFSFMNRNEIYQESLLFQEDTQIFHARFDPNNQYLVKYNYNGESREIHTFFRNGKYWTFSTRLINEDFITEIIKI